jgi:hypothetical protein
VRNGESDGSRTAPPQAPPVPALSAAGLAPLGVGAIAGAAALRRPVHRADDAAALPRGRLSRGPGLRGRNRVVDSK